MRFWMLWLVVLSASAAPAADPPPPNLKQPVDYVSWINSVYEAGIVENASDGYGRAIELLPQGKDILTCSDIAKSPARNWSNDEQVRLRAWIAKCEPALAEFSAAAKLPRCYFPAKSDTGSIVDVEWPYVKLRVLITWSTARARLRLLDNDIDAALNDLAAVLGAARHLEMQPATIAFLLGASGRRSAYAALQELPALVPNSVSYDDVRKRLRKIDPEPGDLKAALLGERVFFNDLLQRKGIDADGDGRIEVLDLSALEGETRHAVDPPRTVVELSGSYSASLASLERITEAGYPEAIRLEEQGKKESAKLSAFEQWSASLLVTDKSRRMSLAHRNAARAIILMHAYKAAEGKWPETLRDAMKIESPKYRADPFSEGELGYRLRNGQPLLYSIGPDGEDNDGRPQGNEGFTSPGDVVFWPLAEN